MRCDRKVSALLLALTGFHGLAVGAGALSPEDTGLPAGASGISVQVNPTAGTYTVAATRPAWTVSGSLDRPLTGVSVQPGRDRLGAWDEVTFHYEDGGPMAAGLRRYREKPLVLITATCLSARKSWGAPFPSFTRIPSGLQSFGYGDGVFAPPRFRAGESSSPTLLYDDRNNALLLSPADNFMVARTAGDGTALTSGLNADLADLPDGFTHRTLLATAPGINAAWDLWGQALTDLQGKRRPANDADVFLRTLGYWTDNGATYYYNYDQDLGYAGTLLAARDSWRAKGIPIRYLQLDSWWYRKTRVNPQGRDEGKPKNPNLPEGQWNAYGGLLEYVADPFLFPYGLRGFHQQAGLPLATHNRWIDRDSPYHERYRISGLGAVDPAWWNHVAAHLAASGVRCYEQDWLNEIHNNSPQFRTTTWAGAAFMENMAAACRLYGLSMQYCMGQPRHYLQGSRYDNLTSVRVSGDRFERGKWQHFLFTSRLASALGEWPWVDVFMSRERENLLLATLSAGLVGIGDPIGKEDTDNIRRAVRADGVIVKPDQPIVPVDAAYHEDVRATGPLVAYTMTDHGPRRTLYVFAYSPRGEASTARFRPADLGVTGPATVYDAWYGTATPVAAGAEFRADIAAKGTGYYIVAPAGRSGIALVGDAGKFASMGRKRIVSITEQPVALTVSVAFAEGEGEVTLHGYSPRAVRAVSSNGAIRASTYDPSTRRFTVTLAHTGKSAGSATLTLRLKPA